MSGGAFTPTKDGVLVSVHLQPRSAKPGLGPLAKEASGAMAVRARVAAAPTDGRANAELCALLAKELGVPKSSVRIERGDTSRHKTLHVAGDTADLMGRLSAWSRNVSG